MDCLPYGHELLAYERSLWDEGFSFIAGVDEAGRGCLAGPVVAAAVVFSDHSSIPEGINDSKQLSPEMRATMRERIIATPGVFWAVAEIGPEEIDRSDILRCTWKAMRAALASLPKCEFILVDGRPVPDLPKPAKAIVKGDAKSASIGAASILAKTHRDLLMERFAKEYPGYGFEEHKGYGTAMHLEALNRLGICAIHRKTFEPVKSLLNPMSQGELGL